MFDLVLGVLMDYRVVSGSSPINILRMCPYSNNASFHFLTTRHNKQYYVRKDPLQRDDCAWQQNLPVCLFARKTEVVFTSRPVESKSKLTLHLLAVNTGNSYVYMCNSVPFESLISRVMSLTLSLPP